MTQTTFTQTSDASYDQCYYELFMEDGSKTIWDDYEQLRNHWMANGGMKMSHVVAQIKATSRTGTKRAPHGFA
jgi:hypothetical protein